VRLFHLKLQVDGGVLYNALGIPIKAGLLYPFFGVMLSPMIAGAANGSFFNKQRMVIKYVQKAYFR